MQLSPQQGDIVRLMMTLPAADSTNKGIALILGVKESAVGTQIERLFKKVRGGPVHSRMELAQRVDYEIARMRGWVKP